MIRSMLKALFFAFLLLLTVSAAAQIPDLDVLVPETAECADESCEIPLYAGPTVQFAQIPDAILDPSRPFVCFGQSDSWTMVAEGSPDSFGPVGWVQTASVPAQTCGELLFENQLAAMVEEDAPLTFTPGGDNVPVFVTLHHGDAIRILGRYDSFLYVEAETGDLPVRGFVPESSVE
ncbi:MAG: hypothetical protein IJ088_05065 [Clostridia bacterium]|nr:hypothetical protein [Clostridia bacterium]